MKPALLDDFGVYCVSNRPKYVNRLLLTLSLQSVLPKNIAIIRPAEPEPPVYSGAWGSALHPGLSHAMRSGITVSLLDDHLARSLSEKKNVALDFLERKEIQIALNIDDDWVLEPFVCERLYYGLKEIESAFAIGPLVRQPNDEYYPQGEERFLAAVEDGVWRWGGFPQGSPECLGYSYAPVQHLAGIFAHRLTEKRYDPLYYRFPYFLHESDFVFREACYVAQDAIAHHWPPERGNLSNTDRTRHEGVAYSVKYFALKHKLGKVENIDWSNFQQNTFPVTGRYHHPS